MVYREELECCWQVAIQLLNRELLLFHYSISDMSSIYRENIRFNRAVSACKMVLFDNNRETGEKYVFSSNDEYAKILDNSMEQVS